MTYQEKIAIPTPQRIVGRAAASSLKAIVCIAAGAAGMYLWNKPQQAAAADAKFTEGYRAAEENKRDWWVAKGIERGYGDGKSAGIAEGRKQGYDQGVKAGYDQGAKAGYANGYKVGYPTGYKEAWGKAAKQANQIIERKNVVLRQQNARISCYRSNRSELTIMGRDAVYSRKTSLRCG